MYEINIENVFKDFSNDKEMSSFSNYLTNSKYYDNSNKLVVGKMKDKTAGVAIKEFVGLKQKMYLHLVNDNSEYKKKQKEWIEMLLRQYVIMNIKMLC